MSVAGTKNFDQPPHDSNRTHLVFSTSGLLLGSRAPLVCGEYTDAILIPTISWPSKRLQVVYHSPPVVLARHQRDLRGPKAVESERQAISGNLRIGSPQMGCYIYLKNLENISNYPRGITFHPKMKAKFSWPSTVQVYHILRLFVWNPPTSLPSLVQL